MSEHHTHDAHDDHHGHDDHDDSGSHSTFSGYAIGFVLSVILTVIPFWLVMSGTITKSGAAGLCLLGIGAVQIVVHMIYFLHMSSKSEGGWNMLAMIFTVMILVIMLSGSVWVMYHLNTNMMPGMTAQQMHDMP